VTSGLVGMRRLARIVSMPPRDRRKSKNSAEV
jgi:hypothetical protein